MGNSISADLPDQTVSLEPQSLQPLPWSVRDAWLGFGLVVIIQIVFVAIVLAAQLVKPSHSWLHSLSVPIQFIAPSALELAYIVPVLVILAWRRANWLKLGFQRFRSGVLGIGCGLLVLLYTGQIVYGLILVMLKIQTQGDVLLQAIKATDSPAGLVIAAVIAAPLVEEAFFRGFLFQGLRQKYSWKKAALLSSAAFAIMHLQPAALLPTFAMGYLFAYVYNKSNSIWPGVVMHFLVNSFAMCALLAMLRVPGLQ